MFGLDESVQSLANSLHSPLVIIAGEFGPGQLAAEPVDRVLSRPGDDHLPAGFQQAKQGGKRALQVSHMLQHVERQDQIDGSGRQLRQRMYRRIVEFMAARVRSYAALG